MTRRLVGAVASCLALLTGLWLILAPFALSIQPDHGDWTDETYTDVWSGIGLAALGLFGMIAFAAALVRAVRAQGMVGPRRIGRAVADPSPPPTPALTTQPPTGELDQLLAPLITALTNDLNRDRESGSLNGETEHQATLRRATDPSHDVPGAPR